MKENDLIFTEDIYSKHLSTINGLRFTPREIDIIACLLSARRTSQIASMLSIAPRTVTTHFRNIMLRLDCNSQEGIINFIERSHKLSILREYYSKLIIEGTFEKSLQEISKLKREDVFLRLIVYWENKNQKDALIQNLVSDLNKADFKSEVRDYDSNQNIENLKNTKNLLFFFIKKEDSREIPQELSGLECIDLADQKDYYFLVFKILKNLLPSANLEIIFTSFREKYEGIQNISGDKYSRDYKDNGGLKGQGSSVIFRIAQLLKDKKCYLLLALLFVSMISIGVVTLKDRNEQPFNSNELYNIKQESAEKSAIRSDLVMPIDTIFLDRPELITKIDSKFKTQHGIQTIALIGPGGVGKTTLSRQYAHLQKAKVIWEINAETKESLKGSIENLAQKLSRTEEDKKRLRGLQEIKNFAEREEKIIQFVKEGLKTSSNWFLIFDNVEEFTDIQKYFPQDSVTWGCGKIILTTRNSNIQNNKRVSCAIQIDELSANQKLELFTKIMSSGNEHFFTSAQKENAKEFLREIPPFPLDVSIAAYYLKSTNTSYAAYLENIYKLDMDFIDFQKNILKEIGDYSKTRGSIIIVSLENLINMHKDFKDLLLFISLLDSQDIPVDLLKRYKNPLVIDNFIYNLKKYSLITGASFNFSLGSVFSLHRSTQSIILAHLIKKLNLKNNAYRHSACNLKKDVIYSS